LTAIALSTTASERDGLGHPIINDIAEDRQGRFWVATNGGGVARLIDDPHEILSCPSPKTQSICIFNNFTCNSHNHDFLAQNSILAWRDG